MTKSQKLSLYRPLTLGDVDVLCQRALDAIEALRPDPDEEESSSGKSRLRQRLYTTKEVSRLRHTPPNTTIQYRVDNDPDFPKGNQTGKNRRRYFTLAEVHRMRDILGLRPGRKAGQQTRTIAFTNFKGGAGKTTSAVNMAEGLAIRGYRVLLVDMDPQASATAVFGLQADNEVQEEQTVLPYITATRAERERGEAPKDLHYAICPIEHIPGLSLIPAATVLNFADFKLFNLIRNDDGASRVHRLLKEGLDTIREDFDVILIDCPPNYSLMAVTAMWASDAAIMPLPANAIDFDSARKFFEMTLETYSTYLGSSDADLPKKVFEWFTILITRHQPPAKHTISGSDYYTQLTRNVYAPFVAEPTFAHTRVLEGHEPSTVYGHHPYSGAKETYIRALDTVENIVDVVEGYLHSAWESDTKSSNKQVSAA